MFNKNLANLFVLAFTATIFMFGNVAKAQFVEDGLVSWWSFDQATIKGETVEDGFGDNNGTIEGDPEIVAGQIGNCLMFDGDDFVTIPHSESLDVGEGEFSLEAWIKASEQQPAGLWINTIYGKGGTNWKAGYLIGVRGDNDAAGMGGVGILVSAAGGGKETYTDKDVNDNKWHHVVGVYSRSAGEIRAYIDGKLEQAIAADKGIDLTNEDDARIGRSSPGSDSADWYAGSIDEVRLYNRALTDAEVETNYKSRGAVVAPSGKLSITWGKIKNLGLYGIPQR